MTEEVIIHNTISEMIAVLEAFAANKRIEYVCIIEDKKAGHFFFNYGWDDLRNDMPAFELFDFKHYVYRIGE